MDLFISSIISYIIDFGAKNPKVVPILAIAYIVGLVVKIARESAKAFVLASPSPSDDLELAKIESSPIIKAIYFIADLLLRFKK